jgi:hypothetical protein
VVIFIPCAAETGNWQERIGDPSAITVQAPHWPRPQPNFVAKQVKQGLVGVAALDAALAPVHRQAVRHSGLPRAMIRKDGNYFCDKIMRQNKGLRVRSLDLNT